MPLPLIPIIGGLASIAAGLIGNAGASRRQKKADKQNEKFWNMQNDYNNPQSQMSRLQGAGLNPNLIYGTPQGAAVGNAEKIAPSKASDYKMDDPFLAAMQAQQTSAQTDNLKADNTVKTDQATLLKAQASGQLTKNAQDALDLSINSKYSGDAKKVALNQAKAALEQTRTQNTYLTGTLPERMSQVTAQLANTVANTNKANIESELLKQKSLLRTQYGIETGDNLFFRFISTQADYIKKIFKESKYKSKAFNFKK